MLKFFSNLRTVRLRVYETKTPPLGLYDIENLKYMKVVYFVEGEKNSYNGDLTIWLDETDNTGKVIKAEKDEAIEKWKTYFK